MPDFKVLLRERIADADVIDELAQHAEEAFQTALADGLTEAAGI